MGLLSPSGERRVATAETVEAVKRKRRGLIAIPFAAFAATLPALRLILPCDFNVAMTRLSSHASLWSDVDHFDCDAVF